MPTLTLLETNGSISNALFQLSEIWRAPITSNTASQVVFSGANGTTYTILGTNLEVAEGLIVSGTIDVIQFRSPLAGDFDLTNLALSGMVLGDAILAHRDGIADAIETVFRGLNYTFFGTTGSDSHIDDISTANDEFMTLTGSNLYDLGQGNDTLTQGGTGSDTLYGGTGDDVLHGRDGNDLIDGGDDNDALYGGNGDDTVIAGNGLDSLYGGDGNDVLNMTPLLVATEIFDGGAGSDTISFAGVGFGYTVNLTAGVADYSGTGFAVSLVSIENVIGAELGDLIFGNSTGNLLDGRGGIDTLLGYAGNDTLIGGEGRDTLIGGDDDDLLMVGSGIEYNEYYVGENGFDTLSFEGLDFSFGFSVNLAFQSGDSMGGGGIAIAVLLIEAVIGSAKDDSLVGDTFGNLLDGRAGNDSLYGGDGNDTLIADAGRDLLYGGANDDLIVVGATGLTVPRTTFDGGSGIDTLSFAGLFQGGFTVNLAAQSADSSGFSFGANVTGFENIIGSQDADSLSGAGDVNTLDGRGGNDTLYGGGGNDVILGGEGDDELYGGLGRDDLQGQDGDDYLGSQSQALGFDDLFGGAGMDLVSFADIGVNLYMDMSAAHYSLEGNESTFFTILSVEGVLSGVGNDVLEGTISTTYLSAGLGDDTVTLKTMGTEAAGGGGEDLLNLSQLSAGVVINLSTSTLQTGFELLFLTNFNDRGLGTADTNELVGYDGNDSLSGLAGVDYISGDNGNDWLYGGANEDVLYGGADNDLLDGGTGTDTLYGEEGDDSYVVDSLTDVVSERLDGINDDGGNDKVTSSVTFSLNATQGVNVIENLILITSANINGTGNGLDNQITGTIGNNQLNGLDGADTLMGGLGNDTLIGGTGIDRLEGGDGADYLGTQSLAQGFDDLDGGTGSDWVDFASGNVDYTVDLAGGVYTAYSNSTDVGDILSVESVTTGDGADFVYGAIDTVYIDTGAGNDIVFLKTMATIARGGIGQDGLVLSEVASAVTINLATSTTQSGFEDLALTAFNDFATGTEAANYVEGAGGDDTLYGQGGNDDLNGSQGNDLLFGGLGADDLYGGTGNDSLNGGSDNDSVYGGDGNDTLIGNTGRDLLDGGDGNDLLGTQALSVGFDDLYGGTGIDRVFFQNEGAGLLLNLAGGTYALLSTSNTTFAMEGVEQVTAANGNDLILAATSTLFVDGGAGNDEISLTNLSTVAVGGTGSDRLDLMGFASAVTIDLSTQQTGFETLDLGSGDDTATGSGNAETIRGYDGNDSLIGLGGADLLDGLLGRDTLFGGNGADVLDGGENDDRLDGGDDGDLLMGGAGNDTLTGGNGLDTLEGGDGNDVIAMQSLAAGYDDLYGGDGTDGVSFANDGASLFVDLVGGLYMQGAGTFNLFGVELVITGDGSDLIVADLTTLYVDSGAGNDQVDLETLATNALGGAGTDILDLHLITSNITIDIGTSITQRGFETLILGAGNDVGTGSSDDNVITGKDGNDSLAGLGGADFLEGNEGNDSVNGGTGNDSILGQDGDDQLFGGENDDSLYGGAGNDTLTGGTGRDVLMGDDDDDDLGTQSLGAGFDDLYGGNGIDRVVFGLLTGDLFVNLVQSTYSQFGTVLTYALDSVERVITGNGNDLILGAVGTVFVDASGGNDTVSLTSLLTQARGGDGIDTLELSDAGGGVSFNLSTATVQSGFENLYLSNHDDAGTGSSGGNLISGVAGNDSLVGLGGNDVIYGGDDNDTLTGGSGADMLYGGAGYDMVYGGDGDDDLGPQAVGDGLDDLDGGTGVDRVSFASITEMLTLNLANGVYATATSATRKLIRVEDVTAGGGNDLIVTSLATTRLDAGAGNDGVTLASLATLAIGGAGIDLLDLALISGNVTFDLGTATQQSGFEYIAMGVGNDSITGTSAANTMTGGAGNDTVIGLGGGDDLRGGDGNDLLVGGAGFDRIDGGLGDDMVLIDPKGLDDINGGGNGAAGDTADFSRVFRGLDIDLAIGSYNDGSALYDIVGIERVITGGGRDTVYGGDFSDWIQTRDKGDTIIGGLGDDTIDAGLGDDHVTAGEGLDQTTGGAGIDTIDFAALASAINFNLGTGVTNGLGTHLLYEVVVMGSGNDTVQGSDRSETLRGENGNDQIDGGRGNDLLLGGNGNDTLSGTSGNDTMTGGSSADAFVFIRIATAQSDVVTDFGNGADRLQLDDALWVGVRTAQQVVDDFADVVGGSVVFDFGVRGTLTLTGITSLTGLSAVIDLI